jgi:transcriptional regulator with XRE-family HTH domain
MTPDKKKFKDAVSKEETTSVKRNKERINNRLWLRESQEIALKVLTKLDDLDWTQRRLAVEMGVSPPQIAKIVSGNQNLTLATIVKLQNVLDISLTASHYERVFEELISLFNSEETEDYVVPKDMFNLGDSSSFTSVNPVKFETNYEYEKVSYGESPRILMVA